MLGRLQTFVNALIAQVARYEVPLELVLVDWNPPPEKPKLAEALQWPADFGPCTVRCIEVPPELHARQRHADALLLYQMIAKNAGIRRARGSFILATNIDVLFSNEFFEWLREGGLRPGKMYRLDRHDVASDVPVEAAVEERLAFCRSHLLRLNAREGTFAVRPDGLRELAPEDIASPGSGIFFGRGWHEPEQFFGRVFRWIANDAEIILKPSSDRAQGLTLELEPGPGTRGLGSRLLLLDEAGQTLQETEVTRRAPVYIRCSISAGETRVLRLRTVDGGFRIAEDLRVLNFRVFRCAWGDCASVTPEPPAAKPERTVRGGPSPLVSSIWNWTRRASRFAVSLLGATHPVRVGLPLSPQQIERLGIQFDSSGVSFLIAPPRLWFRRARAGSPGEVVPSQTAVLDREPPVHTNACGDFTLLAREDWFDLRGYPEFDLFSIHVDSVFCLAAHSAGIREEVLGDPIRMYHIEHEIGSGWTPHGQTAMYDRLKAKGVPWLELSQVLAWADQMRMLRSPMIFNRGNWGLADFVLPETQIHRPARRETAGLGREA